MPRALCLLRDALHYRKECFTEGLRNAGYDVVRHIPKPNREDVLVIWNRYGAGEVEAKKFDAVKARVLVVENGYLGKDWLDDSWYAMALGHHAGAGQWADNGPERWDALGVELAPWREPGGEIVIFGQRGIGEPGIRSPTQWAESAQRKIKMKTRIRHHPRTTKDKTLEHDLRRASACVTWASSAALRALVMGIPVWYAMPKWIGASAGKHLNLLHDGQEPLRDDEARLNMFRRLIWCNWRLGEIRSGDAFRYLL